MPSQAYLLALEACKNHHASSKTYSGSFLRPHVAFIDRIAKRLGVASILDYGCGKGVQYEWVDPRHGKTLEQLWGCEVAKYDPAWPPFAAEPVGRFDLVLCTHTLGAIPASDLGWVVDRLYEFASKAIYVAEKLDPPKKAIHSDHSIFPRQWVAGDWMALLTRKTDIEVTLSTRETADNGDKTMTHHRLVNGAWSVVDLVASC